MTVFGFSDLAFMAAAGGSYDPDALAYFTRVEGASGDNQELETAVKDAINAFIVGCKADGIWNAIKASCILAGARTLNGALQPLVGTAPTSFNFVSGDYNRKTGLVGNGSTKYLNSNRNNNADPQNSQHLAVFVSTPNSTTVNRGYIGAGITDAGSSHLFTANPNSINARSREAEGFASELPATTTGLIGLSRGASTGYSLRGNSANYNIATTSQTPLNQNIVVFGRNLSAQANGRLAFYSIGESLDLALLDTRVTALMAALAAAIP